MAGTGGWGRAGGRSASRWRVGCPWSGPRRPPCSRSWTCCSGTRPSTGRARSPCGSAPRRVGWRSRWSTRVRASPGTLSRSSPAVRGARSATGSGWPWPARWPRPRAAGSCSSVPSPRRCSPCCSRPTGRPSWSTPPRADEPAGPAAGHPQNTQYHTGYILREVLMSVRHALLALLSEGPKYGLQLRQEVESRTGEVWPLNVGQVYTTLQRLERDGLVESDDPEGDGPQKGFRITPAGGQELAEWLRTPPGTLPPPRDELVIKVQVAISVPGVDVHELIQVHRRHLVELMQHYTHVKAEASEHDVGLALVVDAELFRLEAVVRWLDAADTRLTSLPAAGPVGTPAVPSRRHRLEVR